MARSAIFRGCLMVFAAGSLLACSGRPAEPARDADSEEMSQGGCRGPDRTPRVEVIHPTDADDPSAPAKAPPELLDVSLTLGGEPVTHSFPAQQEVDRSIPFYFEPPESFVFKRADLCVKGFGESVYKCEPMKRLGRGRAYELPCERSNALSKLKFYVRFLDRDNETIASLGSRKEPLVVNIMRSLPGALPRLPGGPPPTLCRWTNRFGLQ